MTDKSDLLNNDLQVHFDFGRHGWSNLLVVDGPSIHAFRISDIFTDAPAELIDICSAILLNVKHRSALGDEPGGVIAEVQPIPDMPDHTRFSIYRVAPHLVAFSSDTEGEPVIQYGVGRRLLLGMLMTELWRISKFLDDPTYQKDRAIFPHADLIALNRLWDKSEIGPSFLN